MLGEERRLYVGVSLLFSALACCGLHWSALVSSGQLWSALVFSVLPWFALFWPGLLWSALVCSILLCSALFCSGVLCSDVNNVNSTAGQPEVIGVLIGSRAEMTVDIHNQISTDGLDLKSRKRRSGKIWRLWRF